MFLLRCSGQFLLRSSLILVTLRMMILVVFSRPMGRIALTQMQIGASWWSTISELLKRALCLFSLRSLQIVPCFVIAVIFHVGFAEAGCSCYSGDGSTRVFSTNGQMTIDDCTAAGETRVIENYERFRSSSLQSVFRGYCETHDGASADFEIDIAALKSESTPFSRRKIAFIAAIDAYENLTPHLSAGNKANELRAELAADGYSVIDETYNLGREEFLGKVSRFASQIEPSDEVVFVFIGFGLHLGSAPSDGLIMPRDMPAPAALPAQRAEQVRDWAISIAAIKAQLVQAGVENLTIVFDADDTPGYNLGGT